MSAESNLAGYLDFLPASSDRRARPVLLVVDSFLAVGKVLPLVKECVLRKQPYLLVHNSQYAPHIREWEELLSVRINALDIDTSGASAPASGQRGLISKSAFFVLSRLGIASVLEACLDSRTWRKRVTQLFDREQFSGVMVVTTLKMLFGRFCLREARQRGIPTVSIAHRVQTRDEVLFLAQDPENGTRFRARGVVRKLLWRALLRREQYVKKDGELIIPVQLEHQVSLRWALPEEREFFRPMSVFADVTVVHPTQLLHQDEIDTPLGGGRLEFYPSPEQLPVFKLGDDAFSRSWAEVERAKANGTYLVLYSYADLFAEGVAADLDDERDLQVRVLKQLSEIPGIVIVVARHPRSRFCRMQEELASVASDRVILSPGTGMMFVEQCNVCISVPGSELNLYAADYGAHSIMTRHRYSTRWWGYITGRRGYDVDLLDSPDDIGMSVQTWLRTEGANRKVAG